MILSFTKANPYIYYDIFCIYSTLFYLEYWWSNFVLIKTSCLDPAQKCDVLSSALIHGIKRHINKISISAFSNFPLKDYFPHN
jgi:hypothetical protein